MNQPDCAEAARPVNDDTNGNLPKCEIPTDPKPVPVAPELAPTETMPAKEAAAVAAAATTTTVAGTTQASSTTTLTTSKTVTTSSSIGPIKHSSMVRRSNPSDLLKNLKSVDKRQQKKPTILQQASRDWVKSKVEDNLEDELKQATKSKTGYLDKQNFLQRSDLRQFEKEREIRDRARARTTTSHKRS